MRCWGLVVCVLWGGGGVLSGATHIACTGSFKLHYFRLSLCVRGRDGENNSGVFLLLFCRQTNIECDDAQPPWQPAIQEVVRATAPHHPPQKRKREREIIMIMKRGYSQGRWKHEERNYPVEMRTCGAGGRGGGAFILF